MIIHYSYICLLIIPTHYVTPYKKSDIEPEIDEEIKQLVVEGIDSSDTKSIAVGNADKEASLLSPCPIPPSSIIDNTLIDEIIRPLRPHQDYHCLIMINAIILWQYLMRFAFEWEIVI
jgi:hypothetical protein